MNNLPALRAKELLDSLGCMHPNDMTMEEIAWACGIMVTKKEMDGSEGRILMNAESAIISVKASIDYQPKINYILAHEIGHACLHRKIVPLFTDTHKTLSDWYAKGNQESEANEFANELLMPSELFTKMVKRKKLDLSLIETVATFFGASKTATFLRYRQLGDYPIMIVFIENGEIKWKTSSNDFPFKWLPLHSKVPAWTVAGDYFNRGVTESKPAKVDAIEWFAEDYLIEHNSSMKLWEQCFPVSPNAILSCLWTF